MDTGIAQPVRQNRFRHMRFEKPRHRLPIMFSRALEELARKPANDVLLAVHVRPAQAARNHPADMRAGLDEGDGTALPGGRNRRGGAACRPAIDHHVKTGSRCAGGEHRHKPQGCTRW